MGGLTKLGRSDASLHRETFETDMKAELIDDDPEEISHKKKQPRLINHSMNSMSSYEMVLLHLETHKQRCSLESHEWHSNTAPNKKNEPYSFPYYRRNFITVLDNVLKRDHYLLIEAEFSMLKRFLELSDDSQKLYIRLIQRHSEWISFQKLNYADIKDIAENIRVLKDEGFLHFESDHSNQIYKLLSRNDIKTIFGKSFPDSFRSSNKIDFIENTIRKSSQQRTLDGKCLATIIKEKLNHTLKDYFRLNADHLILIRRLMRLFFMIHEPEEIGFSELYLISIEEKRYPEYRVWRSVHPFRDRVSYLEFEESLNLEIQLQVFILNHQWDNAMRIIHELESLINRLPSMDVTKLPTSVFLLRYTSAWVITRMKSAAVEVFEKLKLHEQAIRYLRDLLSQTSFCNNKRGYWYDRLSINLATHLKDLPSAIEMCHQGISDRHVRMARRYTLEHRLSRLVKSSKLPTSLGTPIELLSCPTRTLVARRVNSIGSGNRALYSRDTDQTFHVEALGLQYYLETEDWTAGFHTEGGVLQTLFTLIFWDIIFGECPDVFQTPYQIAPLDLREDCFYISRKEAIELRLHQILSDRDSIVKMVSDRYERYVGINVIGVQWDAFTLVSLENVISCISSDILAELLRLFAEDFRHRTSGLPDLFFYNLASSTVKFVEVKSERDRLSDKQRIWIHELLSLGLSVEVLHVVNA